MSDETASKAMNEAQEAPLPSIKEASDEEGEVAFMGPAPLCNRLHIHSGGAFVRLAFSEQVRDGAPVHFRSAVALTLEHAWDLRDMLEKALSRI